MRHKYAWSIESGQIVLHDNDGQYTFDDYMEGENREDEEDK